MDTFLTIVHVTVCLILIGVVLLQSGREGGGEIGGGSSVRQTGQSANVFMERLTAIIAIFFMVTSVLLAAKTVAVRFVGRRQAADGANSTR